MTWTSDEAASIVIEVSAARDEMVGAPVEVAAGTHAYVWSGLRPLQSYRVRLRACTLAGCSPHSAEQVVATLGSLTPDDLQGVCPPTRPARASWKVWRRR